MMNMKSITDKVETSDPIDEREFHVKNESG